MSQSALMVSILLLLILLVSFTSSFQLSFGGINRYSIVKHVQRHCVQTQQHDDTTNNNKNNHRRHRQSPRRRRSQQKPLFMSGYGIADDYTWKEDALEIEVTVQVPPGTKAKNVHFKPGITSIDLRVDKPTDNNNNGEEQEPLILLDGQRKLRGRISLDGTYWVFSDRRRSITVTLEKYFVHSNDDMQVLDYDWKGVYPRDDDEVSERKYDEPEILNVREYAASLGVDVDNINRSMVDETMFSSGLNLTQRTLDQLKDKGYLTEITKQADGKEFRTNPQTGEAEPFSFEDDNNSKTKKQKSAGVVEDPKLVNIPFIDTNSPWNQAVPVSVDTKTNKTTIVDEDQLRESLKRNAKAQVAKQQSNNKVNNKSGGGGDMEDDNEGEEEEAQAPDPMKMSDPIELLTVKRLKEILRQQGLKVSGSKMELQERLRNQVKSLLQSQAKSNDKRKS